MTSLAASPLDRIRGALSGVEDWRLGVLIPMAVAAVLGLIGLGDKSMWFDEAYSATIIRFPTLDFLVYMWRNEQQAAPYHLILHAWSALGFDEFTLRLLSVVMGVVGVAAVYAIGRRFGVGLIAALLLAVSPYFIRYEQEARVYTMLLAWSAMCTLAYLWLIERPNLRRAALYVVAAVVLLYVHPLNGWLLVAHALVTLTTVAPPLRWRLLALYAPVVLAAVPLARHLILERESASWIPPASLQGIARTGVTLSGGAVLAIALAIILAIGVWRLWRVRAVALSTLRLPILWLVLVPVGILAMSLVIQPLWVDRYFIAVLVPLFIITAWVIKSLPYRWAITAGLVAISLSGVASWYIDGTKDDWRSAAAYVEARVEPSDGFIIWPSWHRIAFAYYYAYHATAAAPDAEGEVIYPPSPWQELFMSASSDSNEVPAELDFERIWLVHNGLFVAPPELAPMLAAYTTVETQRFGPSQPQVDLLVRRP